MLYIYKLHTYTRIHTQRYREMGYRFKKIYKANLLKNDKNINLEVPIPVNIRPSFSLHAFA